MEMKYCTSCLIPNTRPNVEFDERGECAACRNFRKRSQIDWARRERNLAAVFESAKARSSGYDCVIPVSGGKDSTWQVVRCLEYGLRPLAVTWRPYSRTEVGRKNLENLISLGVDHIDYQISPTIEKKFMLRTLERFGSTAVPMHLALFNIPLKIAVRFRIPLVIWGENSEFEYGNAKDVEKGFALDAEWLRKYGVTHGTSAADWVGPDFTAKDLAGYFGPTEVELADAGVSAIFLGYYLPWDPQETFRVAKEHGFRESLEGPRTGLYTFADIDDDFISIHHYLKWYKFGFTRLFDNLSIEIRQGRISRERAIEIIRETGEQTPERDIEKFCEFAGIAKARFFAIAEEYRNHKIWVKDGGKWKIPGFLIPDWRW